MNRLAPVSISLLLCFFVPTSVSAILASPEYYPDPITVADSARGIVLATCLRANSLESPALFRAYAHLGGSLPDTFSADPSPLLGQSGQHRFVAGVHYALIVRDPSPPEGPEVRRALAWRPHAQFDIWKDGWTGNRSDSLYVKVMGARPGHPEDLDTTQFLRAYRVLWGLSRQTREEQRNTLATLMLPGSDESWVIEALNRHPDLWGEPIKSQYLKRLDDSKLDFFRREWAARQLAKHPDADTRSRLRTFAEKSDTLSRTLAVVLSAHDETPWVRSTLLRIANQMPDSVPDPFDSGRGRVRRRSYEEDERISQVLEVFSSLIEALDPSHADERQALIRIAQGAPTSPGIWIRVLHRLEPDTSRVVRELVWQILEDAPRTGAWSWEDGPREDDILPYWIGEDLNRAMHDPRLKFRRYAYQEAARRGDAAMADTMLAWLREGRKGQREIDEGEMRVLIESLGVARVSGAFDEISLWAQQVGAGMHLSIIKALTSLGDRRGAAILRSYAGDTPCGSHDYDEKFHLVFGFQAIGEASDSTLLARWASECPDSRRACVEAIGAVAGIPTMMRVMLEVEPQPMKPERAQDYERTEASVRRQLALSEDGARSRSNAPER